MCCSRFVNVAYLFVDCDCINLCTCNVLKFLCYIYSLCNLYLNYVLVCSCTYMWLLLMLCTWTMAY
jgi:hypothetical protein